jgi:hypothetical protein
MRDLLILALVFLVMGVYGLAQGMVGAGLLALIWAGFVLWSRTRFLEQEALHRQESCCDPEPASNDRSDT